MTPRRWTGRPPGRPKGEAHVVMTLRLRPDQRDALEELAEQDRVERGLRRPDLSRVLRAILDKALRPRPPRA